MLPQNMETVNIYLMKSMFCAIDWLYNIWSKKLHNKQQISICNLCTSYMFRHLKGHHQGGIYKGIQVQQILSEMCVRGVNTVLLIKITKNV